MLASRMTSNCFTCNSAREDGSRACAPYGRPTWSSWLLHLAQPWFMKNFKTYLFLSRHTDLFFFFSSLFILSLSSALLIQGILDTLDNETWYQGHKDQSKQRVAPQQVLTSAYLHQRSCQLFCITLIQHWLFYQLHSCGRVHSLSLGF